jgi:IS5 family transposase
MQKSFSELDFDARKKRTRRDRFLDDLERLAPWPALEAAIRPFYPASGMPGRPPIGLARMVRMYLVQQCFGLSDEGIEDALYDSHAIRRFVGIDLARDPVPDAITLLKFRHLLERHTLTESLFNAVNAHLAEQGLFLRQGTIVDATLIAAPPSTKNAAGARDPEMHQSRKGQQWYFGMKAHIGVDADSGLVHTVIGTSGNVSDVSQAHALLHGDEVVAYGDAGYQGVAKRPENLETPVVWQTAMRPGKRRALPPEDEATEMQERLKASVRAKVEHPFHVVKNLFRHRKTRYRGLAKNTAQLLTLFGLANLLLAKRCFEPNHTRVAS